MRERRKRKLHEIAEAGRGNKALQRNTTTNGLCYYFPDYCNNKGSWMVAHKQKMSGLTDHLTGKAWSKEMKNVSRLS